MKQFIKDNFVLVIGALLPIIIVILFGLAVLLPSWFVEPPKYNLLFSYGNFYDYGYQFKVTNGKLQAQYSCLNCVYNYKPMQKLFFLDVKTRTVKEIPLTMPVIPAHTQKYSTEVVVPQSTGWQLSSASQAPDGYLLNTDNIRGDMFFDLFSRSQPRLTLSKGGNRIVIPFMDYYSMYQIHFIGWIISGDKQ